MLVVSRQQVSNYLCIQAVEARTIVRGSTSLRMCRACVQTAEANSDQLTI